MMACMERLGWTITTFQPRVSPLADLEARLRGLHDFDMVWVPCFRQRDLPAATRWAAQRGIPVVFDPLISAYDKQVFERQKFAPGSWRARRLLARERHLFQSATVVIADTSCHRDYFIDALGADPAAVHVLPVSAEEELFWPGDTPTEQPPELLFFGTFITLQGAARIADAAAAYSGPPIRLTFLGDGPERPRCERLLRDLSGAHVHVQFETWLPFAELPGRIRRADACFGIFGDGDKSRRVIPNKVYQALACGKPVITMRGDAYPPELLDAPFEQSGMLFVEPNTDAALANAIAASAPRLGPELGIAARRTYDVHFSNARIERDLARILEQIS
jgi:glycosyltransferase involved in cell wall biosynthesis